MVSSKIQSRKSSKPNNFFKVRRYEQKPRIVPNEAIGCGAPVCVLLDSRPKRFPSMCSFIGFVVTYALNQRIFHVQKGDCAYASKFTHQTTVSQIPC